MSPRKFPHSPDRLPGEMRTEPVTVSDRQDHTLTRTVPLYTFLSPSSQAYASCQGPGDGAGESLGCFVPILSVAISNTPLALLLDMTCLTVRLRTDGQALLIGASRAQALTLTTPVTGRIHDRF